MTDKLRASDWEVHTASTPDARKKIIGTARAMVEKYHYSGGASNTATDIHTLHRAGEPEVLGVAWWLPTTKVAAMSVSSDWRRVVALTRLVIHPEVPSNAASFLLGAAMRQIRLEGRWTTLVTYADEGEGHTGAIYRATNWEYLGKTKPAVRYRHPDGTIQSKKRGPKTFSHAEMIGMGFTVEGPFAKHKFRKVL